MIILAGWIDPPNAFANSIDIYPETHYTEEFMRQKRGRGYPAGIFRDVPAMDMLRANAPVYFNRNIDVVAIAERGGIPVILATFAYSPYFSRRPRASSHEYVQAYRETNDCLRTIAAESNAHMFDFASALPSGKHYYTDGRHVTEEGVDFIVRNFLRAHAEI